VPVSVFYSSQEWTVANSAAENTDISLLYVEDDIQTREILCTMLRHRFPRMQITVAENGEVGLETYRQHPHDLIITDINMPLINGIRMSELIRELNPNVEIIALTAYSDTQFLMQAIEAGISHYILKPVDFDRVYVAIERAMHKIVLEKEVNEQNRLIRELNTELAARAEELALANKDLEMFNYSVAHDLRTPMVAISGFAQLLWVRNHKILDAESLEHIRVIESEIKRMNDQIRALLNFSLHTTKSIDKKWTDFSTIIHEICANLQLADPGRTVTFTIGDGIGGFADPVLIRVVLENLLGNAWKYTATREQAVIEFGTLNSDEEMVYFLRDNGVGFDNQKTDNIFGMFQRLHSDEEFDGFGIGMATASRIIQRHGGRIWAEGEPDKGASFYFSL
jgi:signal transduction histidine kinase